MLNEQKGQVALIVLVVSAVVLTLGLSLSKKTISEVKINTDEQLLKEAFNAAESGIDYYLSTGSTNYVSTDAGTTNVATVRVQQIGNATTLDYGEYTEEGKSAHFWLVNHNSDGSIGASSYGGSRIDVCVDAGYNGSIAVDYYYLEAGAYKVGRYGYNFGSGANTITNFAAPSAVTACATNRGIRLTGLTSRALLLVVTPIFTGSRVGLAGDANFPVQGEALSSIGRAGNMDGSTSGPGVSTVVNTNNLYSIPSFLLWAVSAGGNVTGN